MRKKYERVFPVIAIILSIILVGCHTTKPKSIGKTKSFEIGKYSTSTMLGGYSLEFKDNNYVLYNWYSDIAKFDRIGKYEIKNDTITTLYEPLLEIKRIKGIGEQTTFQFKNKQKAILPDCNVKVFYDGKISEKICDENGKITLDQRIETIDSIYFNWNFLDFNELPNGHKYVPSINKINGELLNGFVQLEIILEEDLIGHPVSSNESKLLIVGPNELYPGLDYDPETIYLGGILKKASK